MFGRSRGQNDVDEMFGLLTRLMDKIEYDIVPTLQGQYNSMNNLMTNVSIHDNRISVLAAKIQSLVERVNRHLPQLGSAAGAQPSAQVLAISRPDIWWANPSDDLGLVYSCCLGLNGAGPA